MESLTLTVSQTVATYQVQSLSLNWTQAFIQVVVMDAFNKVLTFNYTGATATTLMIALNKANFSVTSLHKTILNRLVTDGFLPAGSVTGTPD